MFPTEAMRRLGNYWEPSVKSRILQPPLSSETTLSRSLASQRQALSSLYEAAVSQEKGCVALNDLFVYGATYVLPLEQMKSFLSVIAAQYARERVHDENGHGSTRAKEVRRTRCKRKVALIHHARCAQVILNEALILASS
ncbi:hypothetical protein GH5_02777 [Leishmania sp. Ghana 2012 LV757]|uniref:hypothetical protein n=1 Tax=Leishmania sp. Ghana 2012 LV757 TaxID=2803181 RepID=UPI001B3F378C|nr:hypothetical protein GH5_02777 [Leishmania sp. Ghana 2012 LV757]